MFDIRLISIFTIILFLSLGCKDSPTTVEDTESTAKKNTLNISDIGNGDTGDINDYFYHEYEGIEAQFLYHNAYITRGLNSITNTTALNPYLDTLNFRTFPYYTVEIENVIDTISYMLSLTPENIDNYSTLFPLDETNTSTQNWCNEMLVEYEGNCPDSIEVNFDYIISATSTIPSEDIDTSKAEFLNKPSVKKATFEVVWTNIDSIFWDSNKNRYDQAAADSTEKLTATLIDETDFFDSLIFIGVIDTNQYSINDLMFIDRIEWERYDTTYKSAEKSIKLETTFEYEHIKVPEDSPVNRINGDCNQNLNWDPAEFYVDYGADWCPDSLETGEGICEVVDSDIDGEINDEEPCNCLYNWIENVEWTPQGITILIEIDTVNVSWNANNLVDPNGDNWGDCGVDSYCPGHENDQNSDENGTESNGVWDIGERLEENGSYNFDVNNNKGEYYWDVGNGVIDMAEFCVTGEDNECDGTDPFEDRNCNGKWDDQETIDKGNGIWDDDEGFIDGDNDGIWDDGNGNFREAEPLYTLSGLMNTFIVDHNQQPPVAVTKLDTLTSVGLYYGTIHDSIHVTYNSFLKKYNIEAQYSESFYNIDKKLTIYTNKIIESPIPGTTNDYHLAKTKWFQDTGSTPYDEGALNNPEYGNPIVNLSGMVLGNYGYDYHLFKYAENGNIIKMVHPAYFYYYGYYDSFDEIELGSWRKELSEEIYIYTYNGQIRSGEYYYTDTTIVTDVADYYIEQLYEVSKDTSVIVPFRKVTYYVWGCTDINACNYNADATKDDGSCEYGTQCDDNDDDSDVATYTCKNEPSSTWLSNPNVNIVIENDYKKNCPPVDTTLKNTFKITKTKTVTMIGSGVEFGLRNTIWLGTEGLDKPLGIVKDQLEIRWSEPYWKENDSGWEVISRIELRSLRKTESESSSLLRMLQPRKRLSLNKLGNEANLDNEPYILNTSYGIHKLRLLNEK